ncbi:APC family permease [Amycolatopsis sp. NPDC006131]|uniref:APC family permease n=1 Tax=Amycolatopsis sp. NPDC006131 TaxID=3156731 RepID=UPI0033BF6DD3
MNPDGNHHRLRPNAVGIFDMILMVIAVTAPLTAVASNLSLSLAFGAGTGTVGVLVLVLAILLVFSAGYVALSRQVVNAGAYFAYIGFGLGRRMGGASALVATLAYNVAAAGMSVAVGYFGHAGLSAYLGVDVPWWVIALVAVAATWVVGYFGVTIAGKVNVFVAVTEFAVLLAFAIAVLVRRPGGFSFDVLAPGTVFGGNFGLAVVFCILSFAGYEAAAIYGEEARSARRNVGRATYSALIVLAVTFVFVMWAIAAAFPDAAAAAQADPGALLVSAITAYLGGWAGPVLSLMITFSFFAAALSFHAIASRYMFSLARDGFLPRSLSRVHHRRRTPVSAGTVQLVVCVLVVVPFAVAGADPIATFFPAVSGITALAIIYLMAACSASIVTAAARGRISGSTWAVRVAPSIACVALVSCGVVIVAHYTEITGSDSPVISALPLTLVVAAVYGWLAARTRTVTEEPALA